jgi:hypothetical protein
LPTKALQDNLIQESLPFTKLNLDKMPTKGAALFQLMVTYWFVPFGPNHGVSSAVAHRGLEGQVVDDIPHVPSENIGIK